MRRQGLSNYYDHMFYIPIYHFALTDWNIKQQQLLEIYNSTDIVPYNDLSTDYYHNQDWYRDKIQMIFKNEIKEFCVDVKGEYRVIGCWFETSKKGEFHTPHDHGVCGYSAVCYIKYNGNHHTPTQFISPYACSNKGNYLKYVPEVEEGSLIIFPSNVLHYTHPNRTDDERIILSFNLS